MARRALLLCALLAPPAPGDELDSATWQHLRTEASALGNAAGERERKLRLVQAVALEDSERAARLLLDLAASSAERRENLDTRLAKAEDAFRRVDHQLRARHGRRVSHDVLGKSPKWRDARETLDRLHGDLETETAVLEALGRAFAGFRSPEAAAALGDARDAAAARARRAPEARRGILGALAHQPPERVADAILAFAGDASVPEARARAIDWIGEHRVAKGYEAVLAGLQARESAVARSAVAALEKLDERRCVPALVAARGKATGLLAEDLERALHAFTGKTFTGAGADAMWAAWWRAEGAAWLASADTARHDDAGIQRRGEAEFYGIATRSNRIVFVLDRSGSMASPVPKHGPVSGSSRDESVPGDTRLEVAKNELERTIRKLRPDVKFAVVFYSHEVHAWRPPPALVPATPENRKAAIDWFAHLDPLGSTLIFAALDEALRYARTGGGATATDPLGADTIFLLSDGAPTVPGGEVLLEGPALEEAVRAFLEANRPFRCVVHTIGVGPEHNKDLMMRLARETGGTYRAVAMK